MKSDLNGNYHVDGRVRNSGIHDPMSPQLLIYDRIKVYHICHILKYTNSIIFITPSKVLRLN